MHLPGPRPRQRVQKPDVWGAEGSEEILGVSLCARERTTWAIEPVYYVRQSPFPEDRGRVQYTQGQVEGQCGCARFHACESSRQGA